MKGNNQAYKLWLCLLCSFLLLPLEIQAQEKGDSITGKVHKIDEVTVTAKRPPAKVTTGSPVQLINKEDIKNLGLQNMADAVRRFCRNQRPRLRRHRRSEDRFRPQFRSCTHSSQLRWSSRQQQSGRTNRYRAFLPRQCILSFIGNRTR